MELVTQDLRNASFGMVTSLPYASGAHSISLLQMDETGAYQVLKGSNGQGAQNFQNQANFNVIAPSLDWKTDDTVLLLNPTSGQGTALTLSKDANQTGHDWLAVHSQQANTICWDPGMLAVKAEAIGYSYDADNRLLLRATGLGSPTVQPVAFNVDGFDLSYIGSDGSSYSTLDAMPAGVQAARIAVTIKMSGTYGGKNVNKTLTSYAELPKQFTLTQAPLVFVPPVQGSPGITCPWPRARAASARPCWVDRSAKRSARRSTMKPKRGPWASTETGFLTRPTKRLPILVLWLTTFRPSPPTCKTTFPRAAATALILSAEASRLWCE